MKKLVMLIFILLFLVNCVFAESICDEEKGGVIIQDKCYDCGEHDNVCPEYYGATCFVEDEDCDFIIPPVPCEDEDCEGQVPEGGICVESCEGHAIGYYECECIGDVPDCDLDLTSCENPGCGRYTVTMIDDCANTGKIIYHYEAEFPSHECEIPDKLVDCIGGAELSFFGIYHFVIALLLIVMIYVVIRCGKEK